MFFRRIKHREPSFQEHLDNLKRFKIDSRSQGPGRALASRDGCAAILEDVPGQPPRIVDLGVLVGEEIAVLWSGGFQMFLVTPSGRRAPAQAAQLEALHNFSEDLKEALGLTSLYNESLGTTSTRHMYDRVEERDTSRERKPWEVTTET